jgi:hypothetical protein
MQCCIWNVSSLLNLVFAHGLQFLLCRYFAHKLTESSKNKSFSDHTSSASNITHSEQLNIAQQQATIMARYEHTSNGSHGLPFKRGRLEGSIFKSVYPNDSPGFLFSEVR